jgi:hypothetical protein
MIDPPAQRINDGRVSSGRSARLGLDHRGRPRRAASSETTDVARLSTPCGRGSAPAAVTARWIAAATPGAGNVDGRADSARVAMGASSGPRAGIPSVVRRDGDLINAK